MLPLTTMITNQANSTLSCVLNHPSFIHSHLTVQYQFDGGCTVTYYTADTNEHRCCFEIFSDGSISPVLIHDQVASFNLVFPLIQHQLDKRVDR